MTALIAAVWTLIAVTGVVSVVGLYLLDRRCARAAGAGEPSSKGKGGRDAETIPAALADRRAPRRRTLRHEPGQSGLGGPQ